MTIQEFRNDPQLPGMWAKQISSDPLLQTVLDVLNDNHPNRFPVKTDIQDDLSGTQAALQLGFARGYSAVLNTIRHLAESKPEKKDPGPPTYEPQPTEEILNAT